MRILLTLLFSIGMVAGLSACEKDHKPADAGKAAKAASSGTAASAAPAASAATPMQAAPTPAPKSDEPKTAGKGEMKEVCIDKVGKDGKVIMGKDGKPVQECRKIRVRQKLDATEIPPAKK